MFKLISKTVQVDLLEEQHINRMYEVFQKYYSNTTFEKFKGDLLEKTVVFLLLDKKTNVIQGFSTLVELSVSVDGKEYRAAFSGDTIVEKKYWGQGVLGVAFLKYLFMQKIKQPLKPYYWFLISKGFKTYLLMANNFSNHYPRHEQETPRKEKKIIDELGMKLYGNHYNSELGIIEFNDQDNKDSLRDDVAPITVDMLKNQRISYFIKKNTDWAKGNELACLAEMSLFMPFYYQMKNVCKTVAKLKNKKKSVAINAYKREKL